MASDAPCLLWRALRCGVSNPQCVSSVCHQIEPHAACDELFRWWNACGASVRRAATTPCQLHACAHVTVSHAVAATGPKPRQSRARGGAGRREGDRGVWHVEPRARPDLCRRAPPHPPPHRVRPGTALLLLGERSLTPTGQATTVALTPSSAAHAERGSSLLVSVCGACPTAALVCCTSCRCRVLPRLAPTSPCTAPSP